MKKMLLPIDLLLGAIQGLFTIPWLGWFCVIPMILCSLLWAIGGQYGHAWRVYGIPLVLCSSVLWFHMNQPLLVYLPYPFMALILSLGYGLPSTQPYDKGSSLGRFWIQITEDNEFSATIYARGTIILGVGVCMIPWLFLR